MCEINEGLLYKTENSIVVFIDVLGASDEIKKDVDNSLNCIHEAYDSAIEICKNILRNDVDLLKTKIFSDNIVISIATNEENLVSRLTVAIILSGLIQESFLHNNMLVRGGIAYGKFFIDDTMLWGTALLDAYKLESSVAFYPRIIIHPQLMEQINSELEPGSESHKLLSEWLYMDNDGLLFIDYINFKYIKSPDFLLLTYIDDVKQKIKDCKNNVKVWQKLQWHNEYLNKKSEKLKSMQNQNNLDG